MKNTFKLFATLAATTFATSLFFTACKKELSPDAATTEQVAINTQATTEDDAEADVIFDDVFDNVMGVDDEVGVGAGIGIFGRTSANGNAVVNRETGVDSLPIGPRCFTVTVSPLTPGVFPKTITIDFGNGCTGRDGRTRKGQIVSVYTGRLNDAGSEATTTFNNYFVDSVHVEGTHKIKNNSTATNRIFTRTVINGKLSKPSGNYILWNATHTNTQVAGGATFLLPLDDEFDITGTATGQALHGTNLFTWSRSITTPLHKRFTCRWFVSGTVSITRNGNLGILDFGNGTCDNQAVITINGVAHNITLR